MRLLFVVHGMGSNPPGWEKPLVKHLDQLANRYLAFKNGRPLSEQVKIVPINYDQVFSDIVAGWNDAGSELKQALRDNKAKLPQIQQKISDVTMPQSTSSVFWSTLIDPILYRGISDVRRQVLSSVIAQVLRGLQGAGGGQAPEASVLCHSLGTIVMHDALTALGTEEQGGSDVFTSERFRFENLFSVANVSRLGPDDPDFDPYDSCVRPVSAGATSKNVKPYLGQMFTFRHRWDPFTFLERFEPSHWGEDYFGGKDQTLFHFRAANVHGLSHYMDHPAVHVPIINNALGKFMITEKERLEAISKYAQFPTACTDAVLTLKARLEEIEHLLGDVTDWKALDAALVAGLSFYEAARAAEGACHELVEQIPAF